MKAEMTVREKVMLGILGVLVLFCVYYFVFLVPTNEKIETYKSDTLLLEVGEAAGVSDVTMGSLSEASGACVTTSLLLLKYALCTQSFLYLFSKTDSTT